MDWIESFSTEDQAKIRRWLWALNKSDPQRLPRWFFPATLMLGPLAILLFDYLSGRELRTSVGLITDDFLIFTGSQVLASVVAILGVPFLRLYIYGSVRHPGLPIISPRSETLAKITFGLFNHVLAAIALLAGLQFFSHRSFDPSFSSRVLDTVWMAIALTPTLIPTAVTLSAKIKLVKVSRLRARESNQLTEGIA
ncbi:hypothetical protein [Pseudobacteriovorax antillogorgiicola]|uniref:hypothetical protein n=1 Tax=Pseudobacteriovorax antillogorgiicola TaxID=1513793 RepID=UPI00105017D0|nr:hypothetical protein [Pseudobacteriovorax antillogorgiicola]